MLEKSPWIIDNNMLILVAGFAELYLSWDTFEVIEGWAQLWGFQTCDITKVVARELLQMIVVQMREISNSGFNFFDQKSSSISPCPIQKCNFLGFIG